MRLAHFRLGSGDEPDRCVKIELHPFGMAQLAGADEKSRRIKPGVRLLVDGFPNRVGALRGLGNAIGFCAIASASWVRADWRRAAIAGLVGVAVVGAGMAGKVWYDKQPKPLPVAATTTRKIAGRRWRSDPPAAK